MSIATKIIQGFLLRKSAPLDARKVVDDEAARLAIEYPYHGLVVKQLDTKQKYEYVLDTNVDGSVPSNIAEYWELRPSVHFQSGVPDSELGAIGDLYIDSSTSVFYEKTNATTWTAKFTTEGSSIYTGTGAPTVETGLDGDTYISNIGDVYTKSAGVWNFQFSIKGANGVSDRYATTSTTSLDMTTISDPQIIVVDPDLNYTVGQEVIVASRGTLTKYFTGLVASYDNITGDLELAGITANGAAGAEVDWDVNLNGVVGRQGKAFKHTESNVNLTDAKITAVEAGSWTPETPWSASILNDNRTSLVSPTELSGSKAGHSIVYDGTTWYDNGRWLGFTGAQGVQGPGYNAVQVVSSGVDGAVYKLIGINGAPDQNITIPYFVSVSSFTDIAVSWTSSGKTVAIEHTIPADTSIISNTYPLAGVGYKRRILALWEGSRFRGNNDGPNNIELVIEASVNGGLYTSIGYKKIDLTLDANNGRYHSEQIYGSVEVPAAQTVAFRVRARGANSNSFVFIWSALPSITGQDNYLRLQAVPIL